MFFDHVPLAPADPLFGIKAEFMQDSSSNKVLLTVGIYQNDDLEKKLMSSVHKAAVKIAQTDTAAEYLPIDGLPLFVDETAKLVFTGKFVKENSHLLYGAQTVGGTSALRIGGEFLFQHFNKTIYLSSPTWVNHKKIFSQAGMKTENYPYYDDKTNKLLFEEMFRFFEKLPEKSVILLQPCCHNPTGADLSLEEWRKIADLFKAKKHLAFFDFAYLGFGDGFEKDAAAIRIFSEMNLEFLVAFSLSKNFSLYKQRTGALFVYTSSQKSRNSVASNIKGIIRANYSNPPAFGAQIAAEILSDVLLRREWEKELEAMRQRINKYRNKLSDALGQDFSYLKNQRGLFSLLGLNVKQVELLKQQSALYLPASSRINIAGLGVKNLDYVVTSLKGVLK